MIRVLDDPETVASAAARRVLEIGRQAIAERGAFRIALSGGSSPRLLYRNLAATGPADIEWKCSVILFADERAVPPDHPDSNYRLVKETLIDPLDIGAEQVRRMRGEADDLDAAAREYETELDPPLDVMVAGIGPDGHTASLFPGHAAVRERRRRCVAVLDGPKPPPRRITVTPRALSEARAVLVLATGSDKAAAVAAAFDRSSTPERCPAMLLRDREWFMDHAAAASC